VTAFSARAFGDLLFLVPQHDLRREGAVTEFEAKLLRQRYVGALQGFLSRFDLLFGFVTASSLQ
jgi:hypothetical protein